MYALPILLKYKHVRCIYRQVNANDENGLLVGSWGDKFEFGTPPYAWTGSVAILEQYLKAGGRPVKYGQCWVFSAVVVTGECQRIMH